MIIDTGYSIWIKPYSSFQRDKKESEKKKCSTRVFLKKNKDYHASICTKKHYYYILHTIINFNYYYLNIMKKNNNNNVGRC